MMENCFFLTFLWKSLERKSVAKRAMFPHTQHLIILCILALKHVQECLAMTNVVSERLGFGMCLTSQDNLLDPRKVVKYIDEMKKFKVELIKTRQYYEYCGNELKVDIEGFTKWVAYATAKIDLELEFATAVTHLIQKKSDRIDVIHLEFTIEQLDDKIIEKSFKELQLLQGYLESSEANKCVDRLKRLHEVSDKIFGRFGWIRKLYCKLFKKEEESFTKPHPEW